MPNRYWLRLGAALCTLAAAIAVRDTPATATTADEQKAICEEAAGRYRELYGKAGPHYEREGMIGEINVVP